MTKNQGQVLTEFVLVLAVLLIVTTGVVFVYKKFWKTQYRKVSAPSSTIAMAIVQVEYVK